MKGIFFYESAGHAALPVHDRLPAHGKLPAHDRLPAHDKCLVAGSFQAALHLRRFIEGGEAATVIRGNRSPSHSRREILFLEFIEQAVGIDLIAEEAGLYRVRYRGGRGVFRKITAHPQGIQDPFGDGKRDVIEIIVKEIMLSVSELINPTSTRTAGILSTPEHYQPGAGLDAQIDEILTASSCSFMFSAISTLIPDRS